jgi:type III pantothenate kinase
MPSLTWDEAKLLDWLGDAADHNQWWIASVNRPAAERLTSWLKGRPAPAQRVRLLRAADVPITVAVPEPEKVGVDRLAGAAAANRLRTADRPAIVIGAGTAITVDLVSADGVFCGGAILPGIGTSARALNQFTDLLPKSSLEELATPPPALGTSTLPAINSGLYWGAVGAMRELIARLSETLGDANSTPEVFLTGGAAPSFAVTLGGTPRYVEHLVLSGIALARPEV